MSFEKKYFLKGDLLKGKNDKGIFIKNTKSKRCVVFRISKGFEATGRACLYQVHGQERK